MVLPGKVIAGVEVLREKSFKGELNSVKGLRVVRVGRRAKMIMIRMDEARKKKHELNLVIHLKMTGQLIYQPSVTSHQPSAKRIVGGHPTLDWINKLPSKHTRVVIRFTDGSRLYFNDMRVFGWVRIMTNDELQMLNDKLPPDVIDEGFSVDYLKTVLKGSARAVKLVLMDQSKIGGLGNIYANDALWLSYTKPTRKAKTLKVAEIKRLHKACIEVIERGIATGGASESTYKHINGMGGKYQEEFLVYKREEEECLRKDGGVITKIKVGGRGTFYCPVCQK